MTNPETILAVYLILKRGDKVLLSRRTNTKWADGWYSMVAGHIDGNETIRQAMAREAKEEAGIDIRVDDLRVVHVVHRHTPPPGKESLDFFLTTDRWTGEPKNMGPKYCDDMQWFESGRFPPKTLKFLPIILDRVGRGMFYSEYGFDDGEPEF